MLGAFLMLDHHTIGKIAEPRLETPLTARSGLDPC